MGSERGGRSTRGRTTAIDGGGGGGGGVNALTGTTHTATARLPLGRRRVSGIPHTMRWRQYEQPAAAPVYARVLLRRAYISIIT